MAVSKLAAIMISYKEQMDKRQMQLTLLNFVPTNSNLLMEVCSCCYEWTLTGEIVEHVFCYLLQGHKGLHQRIFPFPLLPLAVMSQEAGFGYLKYFDCRVIKKESYHFCPRFPDFHLEKSGNFQVFTSFQRRYFRLKFSAYEVGV